MWDFLEPKGTFWVLVEMLGFFSGLLVSLVDFLGTLGHFLDLVEMLGFFSGLLVSLGDFRSIFEDD